EIAKQDVNVLWERNNFVVDLNEKKVKALLFEYNGFNIYKKDTALDGLKELILLALTKNKMILGKPKRADFIEKSDAVIQFAEDILMSATTDDIENIITSFENEVEYRQLQKEKKIAERRKNNIFLSTLNRFKKEPEKKDVSDEIKNELYKQSQENSGKDVKSNKSMIDKITSPKGMIITISVLVVCFIVFVVFDLDDVGNASSNELDKAIE